MAGAIGKPYSEVNTWAGDPDDGVCPVCHCRMLNIGKTNDVECPVCGIWGKMEIVNGQVKVNWSQQEIDRARNTPNGIYEHYNEIQNMIKVCVPKLTDPNNKALIDREMDRYKKFDELAGNK